MATYALTVSTNALGLGVISTATVVVERKRTIVTDIYPTSSLYTKKVATNISGIATIQLQADDGSVFHEVKIFDVSGILVYKNTIQMPPQNVALDLLPLEDIISASAYQAVQAKEDTEQLKDDTLILKNAAEASEANAANSADAAATSATNAANSAATSTAQAVIATNTAVLTAADRVQTAQDVIATAAARDASFTASKIYATAAAGAAATTDGQTFYVLSSSADQMDGYKNNAGVAQYLTSLYTKAYFDNRIPNGYSASGYLIAALDAAGKIYYGITSDYIDAHHLPVQLNAGLTINTESGGSRKFIDYPTTYVDVFVDSKNQMLRAIDPVTGYQEFYTKVNPKGGINLGSVTLGDADLTYGSGYSKSEYDIAFTGLASDVFFGLKKDGTAWAYGKQLQTGVYPDSPLDTTNYLVYIASAGSYRKIMSASKTGGAAIQLSPTGYDSAMPRLDVTGTKVMFNTTDTSVSQDGYIYAPIGGGTTHPVISRSNKLVMWGDSIGLGTAITLSNGSYLPLKTIVSSTAWGGQGSDQVAARNSAKQLTITCASNVISNSGATSITAITPTNVLGKVFIVPSAATSITGTVVGIHGTLSKDASDVYTFTPDTLPVSPVSCPAASVFAPDVYDYLDVINVLEPGRNDVGAPQFSGNPSAWAATTQANIASMIANQQTIYKKYIVMGVTTQRAGEDTGTAANTQITAHNAYLAATYGSRFLDTLAVLQNWTVTSGLATAQDLTDVSLGRPPQSLMLGDNLHPNATGYAVICTALTALINSLGW